MSNAELLARAITDHVLLLDVGNNKTIGDLTSNDQSHAIYNSWVNICIPLVQYIGSSGSISPSGSLSLWGTISGSIQNQSDLWSILQSISGSIISEVNDRVEGDNELYNSIISLSGSIINSLDLKENLSNKSTNINLGTSNTLYPTQNAVKMYVDNLIGSGSTSEGLTDVSNIGTGEGLVFKELSGSVVQLRTLKSGNGIEIQTNDNEILLTNVMSGSLFNLDGGTPSSVYGGIDPIDGGGV